jgi:hypothetical protein
MSITMIMIMLARRRSLDLPLEVGIEYVGDLTTNTGRNFNTQSLKNLDRTGPHPAGHHRLYVLLANEVGYYTRGVVVKIRILYDFHPSYVFSFHLNNV